MSDIVYFFQIPPLVMSTSGKYGPLARVGARRSLFFYYVLCLSVTKLFLVLFNYFIVIIKKVEMLYVTLNIIAC